MSAAYARLNGCAMRAYLDPTAPIAADGVLTDDPKGAMDLAVALCNSPRMSNLAHGLWGYHGTTREGREVTVQALGIGGPSAAAIVRDLARLGLSRAVRIGSCRSLDPGLDPGTVLVVGEIEARDGAGGMLSPARPVEPDADLTKALLNATGAERAARLQSVDLYPEAAPQNAGVAALDLSSAATVATARMEGMACACALVVSESAGGEALGSESLEAALIDLGVRAAAALSAAAQASEA